MKKFLALVLALVMTMSLVTISAGAKDFDDNADITYVEAVDVMSDLKIVDGDTAGNFNPTNGLTRGAAAKIICNLILGPTTAAELNADTNPFVDVDKDSVFAGYIAYCAKEGIVGGYADGSFKPAAPLTGYAFMKMLLGALGYDAAVEGYTGANWSINVAKQAIGIGLNAGLVSDFNGSAYVTREEAMLYAFNTMKATMVDYDTTITIGDITIAGSNEYDVANNAKTEGIKDDNKMQFAEKYFSKLAVKSDVDVFMRPSNTWTNGKETIGTYVDYTNMIAEYTTAVKGNELFNVIGKTAMEYDFEAYVDAMNIGSDVTTGITKNNKDSLVWTGNGALTQVFVNNDTEDVVITVINTFLAQATTDYNAKKDSVSFKVFDKTSKNNEFVVTVSGEDFDIADVKADEFALVQVTFDGAAEIQAIDAVEIIADTEIEAFKAGKGGSLTVDGEKYSYNAMATYDLAVLDEYTTVSGDKNLKDLTYNVFVDQYGYVIGVDLVTVADEYVFITGVDSASSNLANKPWSANAIFLDGTSKVIEVKKGAEAFADFVAADYDIINGWFKYSVDNNGQYTLTYIDEYTITKSATPAAKVTQAYDTTTAKIDAKNIDLNGNSETVYGNDATIYMLADLETVNGETVIAGVDEVVTGVKNAAFETTEVFPLYKNNGYVIAAIVVGESSTIASDVAYFLNTGVSSESYDKTTKTWTWTRDAIIDGEKVELVETNDTGLSVLEAAVPYNWCVVKYDAAGTVKKIEDAKDADIANSMAKAEEMIKADKELVLLESEDDDAVEYVLKGNTMYDTTNDKSGVLVAEDVKVVLKQTIKNVSNTTYETGVKTLEAILKDLNEDDDVEHDYYLDAVIEKGIMTSVIIVDWVANGAMDGPTAGSAPTIADVVNGVKIDLENSKVKVVLKGALADVAAAANAMTNETVGDILAAYGYTNIKCVNGLWSFDKGYESYTGLKAECELVMIAG